MKKSGKKKINLILIISSIFLTGVSNIYANGDVDKINDYVDDQMNQWLEYLDDELGKKINEKLPNAVRKQIEKDLKNIEIGKFKRTKDSGTYPGIKIEVKEDGEKGGEAKFSVGFINLDGKNQIISGVSIGNEKFVRGAFTKTKLDLNNHNFSLGALQFDGLHGNIYTANDDTAQYLAMFNNNVYKGKDNWGRQDLNSNIALGWGNSAGMQLKPIKKNISDGMDDNELIIGYEQERGNPGIKEKNKPYAKNYDLYHNYYSLKKGFGEPNNNYSTAIGVRNASYGQGAFAIGTENVAGNEGTFAGGKNAISSGINSISYGDNTLSAGEGSISFGYYTKAYGNRAFASGYGSEAYGKNSVAMGSCSYAKAKNSLALSGGTVEPSATDGVSIGKGAVTKIEEGFSIGSEALADREKGKYGYNVIENKEYTNKALGLDESIKYTDYIEKIKDKKHEIKVNIYGKNGIKKLEKENEKIENNIKGLNEFNEINVHENDILQQIKETKDSLERKLNNNKTKIEHLKNERKALDTALKELEDKIKGVTPYFSTVSAISIGNPDKGITRQLTGLSAGSEDTDAVNVAQLKAMRSYVDNKVTLKAGKSAYDIWATSSKAVEYANKHNKELKDLTELDFIDSLKGEQGIKGDGESAYQSWLKQDGNAGKSEGDFVKWLKGNKGEKGQDGKNGKDGKSAFEVWKEKKNKPNAKEEDFFKDITKGAGLLAKEKEEMNKKIEDANKKSDLALGGVSNAVAMANLPQVMGDKKFNLAASYGYYGGSHAVAVGFSGTNDNQNFIYKLSGSVNSKGNLAFGIGAGVMLGSVNSKDKRISDLETRLKEQTEKTNRLEKQLEKVMKRLGQN